MNTGYAEYSLYGAAQQPSPAAEETHPKDTQLRWKAAPSDVKSEQKSVDINKGETLNYFGYGDYNLIGEMEDAPEAASEKPQLSTTYKQSVVATSPVTTAGDSSLEGIQNDSFELGYGTYQLYTGE